LSRRALQALDRAHRLLAQGEAAEAAPLFEQLALAAETNAMFSRAAHLRLQAARSHGTSGGAAALLEQGLRAVDLFVEAGEAALLRTALPRFIAEARAQGCGAEADEVQQAVDDALSTAPAAAAPAPPRRARLPATCPQCGGPARSDELAWIDDETAECGYCGSAVRAERTA
jgi:hypothetical protein